MKYPIDLTTGLRAGSAVHTAPPLKVSVQDDAIAGVLLALRRAEADCLLLERTGPGWMVTLMTPPGEGVRAAVEAAGGRVL